MKSVMQHNFATIEPAQVQRSSFNLDHAYKTTFDADNLIPFCLMEVLPGDTFKVNAQIFARMATPLFPVMDNIYLDTFWFFTPLRILWDNFEKMMGAQDNPGDSIDFTIPQMVSTASTGYLAGSIHDYLGLPTEIPDYTHSAMFHRAYYLTWDQWFRDQNLQNSLLPDTDNGPDLPADYVLQKRGKRHDYFTSCLPAPQRGAAISLPLGTKANIKADTTGTGDWIGILDSGNTMRNVEAASTDAFVDTANAAEANTRQMYADLTNATAATVNALRLSIQLQVMAERDARGGTRFPEILKSHFGVTSPDARLQRPEFLSGSSQRININPVAQTSATGLTGGTTNRGALTGVGTVQGSSSFTKSFVEHGIIMGLVSARADLTYQRGLDKQWSRLTRVDHYFPALAHLGEQAVLNKEIYTQGSNAGGLDDALAFGYQERWSELRMKNSMLTGLFRSNHAQSLDAWHLSQDFSSLPTLGSTFITEAVPMDRVIATAAEPHFIFDSLISVNAVRPLPIYSIPGFGAKL